MTSYSQTATKFLNKYKKSDALVQATQCYYLAGEFSKEYWLNVINKIKEDG